MSTDDKLIYMANQIAREFDNQHPREAANATWDHLWHFWDPRMQAMITRYLAEDGERLSETAKAAVAKLAKPLEPQPRTKATEFNHADDNLTGRNLMSDAG